MTDVEDTYQTITAIQVGVNNSFKVYAFTCIPEKVCQDSVFLESIIP